MCLSTVWTKKKQKEWLKNRKSPLIVYGTAIKRAGKYYPLYHKAATPYLKGVSVLPKIKCVISSWRLGTYYPYYHRFVSIVCAKQWRTLDYSRVLLKWRVYKKGITDIGTQNDRGKKATVIIARKLTLLGEVKPKKKIG